MSQSQNTPYVDIAGLISVQKNYLANLETNNSNPGVVAEEIVAINKNLDKIGIALSHNSSAYVLSGQKTVYDIVQREQNRLTAKKDSVDTATQGQNRLIELNTNYKKRYTAYTNVVVIGIVTLVLFIIILYLRQIPFFPAFILNLATIIIFSVSAVMCGRIFIDINTRDSIYYDELDTNGSFMKTPESILNDISNNKISGSNTIANFNNLEIPGFTTGICFGSSCCSGNTFWDEEDDVCVPFTTCPVGTVRNPNTNKCEQGVLGVTIATPDVSQMTTIESAYNSGDLIRGSKNIASYSPSEYSNYGKL